MAIKKIKVTNFKSFKELDLELGKFNVLIGANASGKSNFIQIFQFLRDIASSGLDNAISMQGGLEYLRNLNIGSSENSSVRFVSDRKTIFLGFFSPQIQTIQGEVYETIYDFSIKSTTGDSDFEIVKDEFTQKCSFVEEITKRTILGEGKVEEITERKKFGEGKFVLSLTNGEIKVELNKPEEVSMGKDDVYPSSLFQQWNLNKLLLNELSSIFPSILIDISSIAIYDFDPKLPKKATPITGKINLETDGNNLAIVLKNIIKHEDKRRKFFNLLNDLLGFVDDLDVQKFADKSLLFTIKEKYFKNQDLPAFLLSDGTINLTAMIISLYFEGNPLTIIEEPERNIHPHIIAKLVNMMKDASEKKQIIVTTHNPEVVKYAGLENLLLVSRDKDGFSVISRPADKKEVKTFLKNEIGIEELYVQSLLEV